METEGPRHWAQLRMLQACERLNIPEHLWPSFKDMRLPHKYGHSVLTKETLPLPRFELLYESEADWRARAHKALDALLDKAAVLPRESLKQQIDSRALTKIPAVRDTSPLELRYEWAAQRYCLKVPFKRLSTEQYSEDRIKKAVYVILDELGLRKGK
jgi:hypothetical protein